MVNNDRIVPVTNTDLLTLYALVLALNLQAQDETLAVLQPEDVEGNFVADQEEIYFASQPVKKVEFEDSDGTLYFVAAYDFEGFTHNGAAVEMTGATVKPNASTLYYAEYDGSSVEVTQIGF